MSARTPWQFIRRRLHAFGQANRANVTVTFALALIPMVGFVGAAVDYSHANSVKAAMQAAADSTALMLSKIASTMTTSQLQTKANDYFKALFNRPEATGLTVHATYLTDPGSQVRIDAASNVKADFMGLLGVSTMKVAVDSQVKWGNSRLRVALALDNTGSMDEDGKMSALKTATKKLLDQLENAASKDGDVYVSIIPFNRDVNVGKSNYKQPWIKWSGNDDTFDEINGSCKNYSGHSKPDNADDCDDKHGKWTADSHSTWNGCVMDRDQDYDTTNNAPSTGSKATLFPAHQYDSCPSQLLALTYDWDALDDKVDDMDAVGNTNQTIGLQWAFQSLTAAPFTIPPKDSKYKYSDVIILMTDGLNTENRLSTSQSQIDKRMAKACSNAKAAGIVVYAIQVNTGGDPTQSVLKDCATDPNKFFELKKASQLVTAFSSIGTALSNLRIAQ